MSIKLLAKYYRKKGYLKWSFSDREEKKRNKTSKLHQFSWKNMDTRKAAKES